MTLGSGTLLQHLVDTIRTLVFYGVFGFFVLVTLIICWPLTFFIPAFSFCLFRGLTRLLVLALRWLVGIRIRFENVEILHDVQRKYGCFLLAPKHQSSLETLIFSLFFPRFHIVYKQEINNIPIISRYMKSMDFIAINRKAGREAVRELLVQGEKSVSEQTPILIFPEGTRTPLGQCGHYHVGVVLVSKSLHLPIVPVAHNAGACFRYHIFALKPGIVTFRFLSPLYPNLPTEQILQNLGDTIESACESLN